MHPSYKIIEQPSVWKASELDKSAVSIALEDKHIKALDDGLRDVQLRKPDLYNITRADFSLDRIKHDIADWINEIMQGRGILLLSGLPVERYSVEEIEIIYWGLGCHFGTPMSQSTLGDRMGHVVDIGGKDPRERAYRNSTELALHTDACDVVAMLCIRKAVRGGLSGFTSGLAVHNEILRTHPELLKCLYKGYRYHRFGEEQPGEEPVTPYPIPVFSERDGYVSMNYLRAYIDLAYQELDENLNEKEVQALDVFDEISNHKDFRMNLMMEPGDIVFFNNLTVLHTRTEFFDAKEEHLRRHLLRLWLVAHQRRPVIDTLRIYEGDGIAERENGSTYFEHDLNYREFGNR